MRRSFLTRSAGLLAALALVAAGCGARMFLNIRQVSLGERLRLFLGGGGNSAVYLHGPEALVVDAKMGDFARRLRSGVEKDLQRSVRRIVLTHLHGDHTQGLKAFPGVGAVLVHPRTRARLLEADGAGALRGVPFAEVGSQVELLLGGEEVRVLHLGVAHTDGDLVVLFPREKVLVAGDLVLEGYEPFADEENGGDIRGFKRALDELMKLEFDQVVPGHGGVMDRAGAQRYRDYLAALEEAVGEQLAEGASEDGAVQAVKLPQFPLEPLPLGKSTREKNVRGMYRALKEAGKRAGP
ncbi:MAG: MBL fold metallo-hydrolase [Myxococcaceae bacterium]